MLRRESSKRVWRFRMLANRSVRSNRLMHRLVGQKWGDRLWPPSMRRLVSRWSCCCWGAVEVDRYQTQLSILRVKSKLIRQLNLPCWWTFWIWWGTRLSWIHWCLNDLFLCIRGGLKQLCWSRFTLSGCITTLFFLSQNMSGGSSGYRNYLYIRMIGGRLRKR